MNIADAIKQTKEMFDTRKIEAPDLSAELLVSHVVTIPRAHLPAHDNQALTPQQETELQSLVMRRCKHEPIPYIIGKTEFFSITLNITNGVFIPRPETETLVQVTLDIIKDAGYEDPRIYDMGTGSGAVIIALALNLDDGEFVASDISSTAVQVSKHNMRMHDLESYVELKEGSLFAPMRTALSTSFDIFVSNPPYIKSPEVAKLPNQIKDYEPHIALDGGRDGMTFYKNIIDNVSPLMNKGGYIVLEADPLLIPVIKTELRRKSFFENVKIYQDASGKDRVISFQTK
jgi:release factor glutamine methyltransferase